MTSASIPTNRRLRRLLSLLAVAVLLPGLVAAKPADRDRRVDAELTFDAVVERVRQHKGSCVVQLSGIEGAGTSRDGRPFDIAGEGSLRADCSDAVVERGSTVRATVRVTLQVQTTASGNPEGYTARTRGVAHWPAPIEVSTTASGNPQGVATTMGGNPQGLKLTLGVATTASGNPEG